jgi:hypothetical protein
MKGTIGRSSLGWKQMARHGAGIGVRMTLLYAALFALYAVVRSIIELASHPGPESGDAATVMATVLSLIVASLAIALLLMPISALAGAAMELLLRWLLPRTGERLSIVGTLVVGLAVAFAIADAVQLILLPAVGFKPLALPLESWLFWFGLPTLLYIAAAAIEGRRLRIRSMRIDARPADTA